jgi:hypothetical protein
MMSLGATMPGGPGVPMNELQKNKESRAKREGLVTPRDSYADGPDAMKEIFERKRARGASFREAKMADYRERFALTFDECVSMNFADAEYRRSIKDGKMKGAFAGTGESFPIASSEDVHNAWMSVGRAKGQDKDKIYRNILNIAKRYNWTGGLPKSVQKRMKKGESGMPEGRS